MKSIYIAFFLAFLGILAFFGLELSKQIDIKYKLKDPVYHCDQAHSFADLLRNYSLVQSGIIVVFALIILLLGIKLLKEKDRS